MAKFSNALLRGTVPVYGTVHEDGVDPLRTFENARVPRIRKSKLDEAFEKSDGADHERLQAEVGGS